MVTAGACIIPYRSANARLKHPAPNLASVPRRPDGRQFGGLIRNEAQQVTVPHMAANIFPPLQRVGPRPYQSRHCGFRRRHGIKV